MKTRQQQKIDYVMDYVKEQYQMKYGEGVGERIGFILEHLVVALDCWKRDYEDEY
jgi:hypothetical protein